MSSDVKLSTQHSALSTDSVDSPPPFETCPVEGTVEAGDDHPMARRAGVDEFVVADIDPNMVDIASPTMGSIEENQITRFEIASAHIFAVVGLLS